MSLIRTCGSGACRRPSRVSELIFGSRRMNGFAFISDLACGFSGSGCAFPLVLFSRDVFFVASPLLGPKYSLVNRGSLIAKPPRCR